MALKSGFFNSFYTNGDYDRKYNADDYSANIGAVISNGVLRDKNNGFRVTASGMVVSVAPGRAWIEGRWAWLDAAHTFPVVVPPSGGLSRIDSVHLVLDTNVSGRQISLQYKSGVPAASPSAVPLIRSEGIYEICLARIWVNPNATTLSITDCRPLPELCGWVTSPVGYDEYFANLDAAFEEWFKEKRNNLSANCLFKQYIWRTVLKAAGSSVAFDIPQYDPTGVDIIQVYVNGLLETEGIDYTLEESVITFASGDGRTGTKVAGTEIVVICYKSIDGTGLGNVSDEITALQKKVAALDDFTDYHYVCTGLDDNIRLSELAQAFLAGESDSKILTIKVYGTMGITSAYHGDGSATSPYKWFAFGQDDYTLRRVIVDFCNTNHVFINAPKGTNNVLFFGDNVDVRNARFTLIAEGGFAVGFNSGGGKVYAEKCWFGIRGSSYSYLAQLGTFVDCYADVRNAVGYSCVFRPNNYGVTRIRGGEYRAYAPSGQSAMGIYVLNNQPNAVVIAEGCTFPSFALDGYVQTHGVNDASNNGMCRYRDIITPLNNYAPSQVLEVIPQNKFEQV